MKATVRILVSAFFGFILIYAPPSVAKQHQSSNSNDVNILAHCPPGGDAKSIRIQDLNKLKRRMISPTIADIDSKVTLSKFLAPGDDTSRFDVGKGATIVGYVADVKVGGVETVNCHAHDPKYRDTHIELTLSPLHDAEAKHVIVEVTPQWREKMAKEGVDWSTQTLRKDLLGHWIKVTGWLFFDEEHANAATNTAPKGDRIWRATAWEIHPITAITKLSAKPK